jgi:soluble lytic murein transglycosylase-like protein
LHWAQTRRFFAWNAANRPEAINALSQKWDFSLAYLFRPIPLKRVIRKLESSRGTYLLVTLFWVAQMWFASLQALAVEDVRRLPMSANLVIDLTTGEPPPNMEVLGHRFHLG